MKIVKKDGTKPTKEEKAKMKTMEEYLKKVDFEKSLNKVMLEVVESTMFLGEPLHIKDTIAFKEFVKKYKIKEKSIGGN